VKPLTRGQATAGKRSRLPAVLVTLCAPALVYFIVRDVALELSPQIAIAAGPSLPPSSHLPQLMLLARTVQLPGAKPGPRELALARRALVEAPLAWEPFVVAAKVAERKGRRQAALRLMEEAKRRRPNRTSTRLQLMEYYGRARDYPRFLREINYVLGRSERTRTAILPHLTRVFPDPASRSALADLLAKEPVWRTDFFNIAGSQPVDPRHASALVERIRARKGGRNMELEDSFYIRTLLTAGRHGEARRVWARVHKLPEEGLITDPGFEGVRAPPPFNWAFPDADVGSASIVPRAEGGPRLEIEYAGGRPVMLAEQTLALSPGSYQLAFSVRGEASPRSILAYWKLSCAPGDKELVRLPTGPLQNPFVTRSSRFTVPAGCSGQTLRLFVEPGDFPGPVSISFGKVDVSRG